MKRLNLKAGVDVFVSIFRCITVTGFGLTDPVLTHTTEF